MLEIRILISIVRQLRFSMICLARLHIYVRLEPMGARSSLWACFSQGLRTYRQV